MDNPNSPIRPRLIIPTSFEEAMTYFEDIYLLKQAVLDLNDRLEKVEKKLENSDEE